MLYQTVLQDLGERISRFGCHVIFSINQRLTSHLRNSLVVSSGFMLKEEST